MDIKINNLPVTIKTITIDGKKLTKQLVQQVPLSQLIYRKEGDKFKQVGYMLDKYDYSKENLSLSGTIIGWINLHVDKESFINEWMGIRRYTYKNELTNTYLILFVNNDGELRRSYIDIKLYRRTFLGDYPQLFI